MKLLIPLLLLLPLLPCFASEEGRENTAALVLLAIDWRQTREIAGWEGLRWVDFEHGWQPAVYETNPLLGRRPSAGAVDRYFLGMAALLLLAQEWLPEREGRALRRWTIAVEAGAVVNNYRIGIRF